MLLEQSQILRDAAVKISQGMAHLLILLEQLVLVNTFSEVWTTS